MIIIRFESFLLHTGFTLGLFINGTSLFNQLLTLAERAFKINKVDKRQIIVHHLQRTFPP